MFNGDEDDGRRTRPPEPLRRTTETLSPVVAQHDDAVVVAIFGHNHLPNCVSCGVGSGELVRWHAHRHSEADHRP